MKNERGIILVLFPFLLLAILGVSALAIDFGNIGQLQNVLTRAADAGTVAGLEFRTREGWTRATANKNYPRVIEEAFRATVNNLILAGLLPNQSTTFQIGRTGQRLQSLGRWKFRWDWERGDNNVIVDIEYRSREDEAISVIVMVDSSRLLGRAVYEGLGRSTLVSNAPLQFANPNVFQYTANSPIFPTGEIKPVDIEMMLDASNSMSCPANGDCDCAKTESSSCPQVTGKVAPDADVQNYFEREFELRRAALNFTRLFNPYRDRIGVNVFQTSAIQLKLLRNADCAGGVDPGVDSTDNLTFCPGVLTQIFSTPNNQLRPSGGTNIMDAFQQAWSDYRQINVNTPVVDEGNRHLFWVLFSDGAPTAGRYNFSNPIRTLGAGQYQNSCPGNEFVGEVQTQLNLPSSQRCLLQNRTPSGVDGAVSEYDYYHYAAEWPDDNGKAYAAPGVLIRAGAYELPDVGPIDLCADILSDKQLGCYQRVVDVCGGDVCMSSTTVLNGPYDGNPYRDACLGTGISIKKLNDYHECLDTDPGEPPFVLGDPWLPYGYAGADPEKDLRRGGAVPWCSDLVPVTNSNPSGKGSIEQARREALGYCLNDISYTIPAIQGGGSYAQNRTQLDWKFEYYNGAIAWADAVRQLANGSMNSAVYVVGLGDPIARNCTVVANGNSIPTGLSDAYQCIEEPGTPISVFSDYNMARKDVLLARIARDVDLLEDSNNPLPVFPFQRNPRCSSLNTTPGEPMVCNQRSTEWATPDPSRDGKYVFTSEPEALTNRFSFVGRNILTRLLDR